MSNVFSVDFSGVQDKVTVTPGVYKARVKNITREEGTNFPYLKWELVILTGQAKGLSIYHITTLKPEGLFNLRNTLIACGFNIPKSAVRIDPSKIIGRTLGIEVAMRESNGNEYPNVKKVMSADEVNAVDDNTAPAAKVYATTPDIPNAPNGTDDFMGMTLSDDDL